MRALRIHLVLLIAAAAWAFLLSGRDPVRKEDRNRVPAWDRDTTEVVAIRFWSPEKEVLVERREDDGGAYLWGTQIEHGGADPNADRAAEGEGAAEPVESADTLEFPVGASGHSLVERLAGLRVVRSLGSLTTDQRARFGLADASAEQAERLAVEFRDGRREFVLGDTTYGGSDRYAREPATGAGYVLSSDVTRPLGIGEGSLRERWLHHYPDDDVAQVVVANGGTERTMVRAKSGDWISPGGEAPDEAFANFMQRVDQLAISGYEDAPSPGALPVLLRVDYLNEDGEAIGFVELFRDDGADRDPYYLRTERTRILAGAVAALAERVAEALGEVF